MPCEIVWSLGAEIDLQDIYERFEDRTVGSGDAFMELIDSALALLRHFPEMAPIYEPPIRRLLINIRKHGVFYSFEKRGLILHAVADLRDNPGLLKERFKRITER